MKENSKVNVNSSENSKVNSSKSANSSVNSGNSVNLNANSSNSATNSNSSVNSGFKANLKAIFALPKWAKVFLAVLSVVAVAGLITAFGLKAWAADKVESGQLVLNGIDKGWQGRLMRSENFTEQEIQAFFKAPNADTQENADENLAKKQILPSKFAFDGRLYFARLDFLLRSKVIAYIDIQGISWGENIDKSAISEIKSQNRHIKFITSQDLQGLSAQNIGKVEYKMDFSPLFKTILKYYLIISLCLLGAVFGYRLLPILQARAIQQIKAIKAVSFRLGVSFLAFVSALFVLATLGFLVRLDINASYFYLALIFSLATLLYKNPYKISSLVFYALFFGVSLFLALYFYDMSGDWRMYHQTAIIYLANNFNPIYQQMTDIMALQQFLSHEIWIEHYLKFAETTQACVYKALGYIESGKAINYLFAFGGVFYAISVLGKFKNISLKMLILLSFLCVFSPVVLAQICNYLVDGLLACALVFVFLSVLDLELSRKNGENLTPKYAIFIFALLATASIKLTGVGYGGFIGVAYLIYRIAFFGIKNAKGVFVSGVISALLIIICNANPLVTNQIQHGHFGYPLMGKDKIDIITGQQPPNFNDLNRFEKLGLSLFSVTENLYPPETKERVTQLKIPFTVNTADKKTHGDMRVAGFGWFFSGILILCLLLFLTKPKAFCKKEFVFAQILVLGSCLINPECWWARYVPQMWLVPFIFIVYSYALNLNAFQKALRLAIVGFLILNLSSMSSIFNDDHTNYVKKQLTNLNFEGEKVLIFFPYNLEKSFAIKLLERGYPTQIISKDELEILQNKGIKFYALEGVVDSLAVGVQGALWNVKPK